MPRWSTGQLLLLAAIWGSSYLFIEIALRGFDPAVVAFARQLIGAACLVPVALSRRELTLAGHDLRWVVVIALVMVGGPTILVAAGQQSVPSSLAGILVSTTPVLTALLAARLDRSERPGRRQVAGILLGLVGVALLFGVDLSDSTEALAGGGALLLASLGYAVGGFLVKHRAQNVPPLGLVVFGSAISAVALLPFAAVAVAGSTGGLGPSAALVELGLVGTALGWLLYYSLIQGVGPARAALVQYLAPAFSVGLGVAFVDDPLTAGTLAGLVLVVLGSWLAATSPSPAPPLPPHPR